MEEKTQKFEMVTVSSLEKVLPFADIDNTETSGSFLYGERYNFQIALKNLEETCSMGGQIKVVGELAPYITFRRADLVPGIARPIAQDDYYLPKEAQLIPDPLFDLDQIGFSSPYKQWRSLWVSVCVPETVKPGVYPTRFEYFYAGETQAVVTYDLEVIGAKLPETDLKLTNWMHYDCICQKHGVKPFSKSFYKIFGKYLDVYVESGFNMLLTPMFTPPLDTKVGGERLTVQLIDVVKDGGRYAFNFDKLKFFIQFALQKGVRYFELSHLFTQWGGKACPKILASVNGKQKRIFGWDNASDSKEYQEFLLSFLPELVNVLKEEGVQEKCYFHLTDEPSEAHLEVYEKCRKLVKGSIGDMPTMDAISEYAFYEKGLIDVPVPIISSYHNFEKANIKELFVYNCCFPTTGYYSGRFIMFPSQRTRILGIQMYQSGVQGYLHWGYNFYRSWLSIEEINPFLTNDSCGPYPAGDGFIVYPVKNGVISSIRAEVENDGFQDYRALKLLEKYLGREQVMKIVADWGVEGYDKYPRSAIEHRKFRETINALIKKQIS